MSSTINQILPQLIDGFHQRDLPRLSSRQLTMPEVDRLLGFNHKNFRTLLESYFLKYPDNTDKICCEQAEKHANETR